MRRRPRREQLLAQAGLAVVGLFVLIPVWSLVILATDAKITSLPDSFRLLPAQPSLDALAEAWQRPHRTLDFLGLLRNSLFVSGFAAGVGLFLGGTMAYAFARFRFPGSRVGLAAVLVGALLPPIALATPLFILFLALERAFPVLHSIGFRGSTLALGILYASFAMPLCLWLMRSAFRAVPLEVEEAALVEGASRWGVFRRIALPIAAPSILIGALVAFLLAYTEFALAWLFASSDANLTAAMVLATADVGVFSSNWGLMAAHALLMTVPIVLIFVVLQRALLRGSLVGSLAD